MVLSVLPVSLSYHDLFSRDHGAKTTNLKETSKYIFKFFLLWLFVTGFPYAIQADLELVILLPQPPKCWDKMNHVENIVYVVEVCLGWGYKI
jgi:hypothetical protein